MNLQQQQRFIDSFCEKMKSTILGKGNDYANADRLSNFKLAGAICGLTPEQNCLSMIATKVARLGVLLGGKTPNNESIEDSLLDLANYAVLLGCIRDEKLDKPFLANLNPETGRWTASEWVPDEPARYDISFGGNYTDELVKVGNDGR